MPQPEDAVEVPVEVAVEVAVDEVLLLYLGVEEAWLAQDEVRTAEVVAAVADETSTEEAGELLATGMELASIDVAEATV